MTQPRTDEPTPPVRSLTFRLSLQDMQMLAARPQPLPQRIRLSIIGGWIAACLIIGLMDDQITALLPWANDMRLYIVVGALTILYYLMQMVARQILTRRRVRAARAPSTDTTIDIWQDHFTIRQDGQSSIYPWTHLADIVLEDSGLTLYAISGQVFHIPQRAFENRQAMLDFNLQVDGFLQATDQGA